MRKILTASMVAGAALLVAACGGGDTAANNTATTDIGNDAMMDANMTGDMGMDANMTHGRRRRRLTQRPRTTATTADNTRRRTRSNRFAIALERRPPGDRRPFFLRPLRRPAACGGAKLRQEGGHARRIPMREPELSAELALVAGAGARRSPPAAASAAAEQRAPTRSTPTWRSSRRPTTPARSKPVGNATEAAGAARTMTGKRPRRDRGGDTGGNDDRDQHAGHVSRPPAGGRSVPPRATGARRRA